MTFSSSRASPPPPLKLDGVTATKTMTAPVYSTSPRPTESVRLSPPLKKIVPPFGVFTNNSIQIRRSFSGDSMHSPRAATTRKPSSPTVNANSYCGRHTDQFLFGGRRMTDIFRAIVRKE